jgi:hypothetical protein
MRIKNYEELDPDNQDRTAEYYLGIRDAAQYVLDALYSAYPREQAMDPGIKAVVDSVDRLAMNTNERRSLWFAYHMGVELDPARANVRE